MLRTLPACDSDRGTAVIAPLSTVGMILDRLVVHDRFGKTRQERSEIRGVGECMLCSGRCHCGGWGTLSQDRPPCSLRVFQLTCSNLPCGKHHALTTIERSESEALLNSSPDRPTLLESTRTAKRTCVCIGCRWCTVADAAASYALKPFRLYSAALDGHLRIAGASITVTATRYVAPRRGVHFALWSRPTNATRRQRYIRSERLEITLRQNVASDSACRDKRSGVRLQAVECNSRISLYSDITAFRLNRHRACYYLRISGLLQCIQKGHSSAYNVSGEQSIDGTIP